MTHQKVLIDSHVLIWLLYEPEKISTHAKDLLQSADVGYISIVSIWELALKFNKHKLAYTPDELIQGSYELNLERLPLHDNHILMMQDIQLTHKDPFDTLLVAQSEAENCSFLTADNNILTSKYLTVSCTN